jgi:hypothetical protein
VRFQFLKSGKRYADDGIGSNQAVNFTAYTKFKEILQQWQPQYADSAIPSYQTTIIGLVSGAMGPLSNAPIDTIKTRLQKTPGRPGETALSRITKIAGDMFKYVSTLILYSYSPNKSFLHTDKKASTHSTRASRLELCVLPPAKL